MKIHTPKELREISEGTLLRQSMYEREIRRLMKSRAERGGFYVRVDILNHELENKLKSEGFNVYSSKINEYSEITW